VVTLEAPKASPTSPTLEGETTLEAFIPKQRGRRLTARTATPTHLNPVSLVSKSINSSRDAAAGLRSRLIKIAHISVATSQAENILLSNNDSYNVGLEGFGG
jgi:hypothetical protein